MDLISVIVPVYNVEMYLSRCVQSIVNQSYKNLEIILVDDGSPDRCPEMCDDWAERDKRIKVIHKKNGGLSDARNAGMKISTGNYVSFIDSDDWIENKFYEILIDTINKYQCDMVGCKYQKTTDMRKKNKMSTEVISYDGITAMSALIDNKIEQVVWNKLYKREIVRNILFERGKYHEDEFWSYQIFGKISKYVEVDYIGYNYFIRSDSIMGERYSLKRLDAIEAKEYRQSYIENRFPELVLKGKKDLLFSCLYQGQLALKELEKNKKRKALSILKKVIVDNPISLKELKGSCVSQIIWIWLGQRLLVFTCKIRNILRIGT